MEVDIFDVLIGADILTDLGTSYGESISTISGTASPGDVFETGTVSGPWSSMVNGIWNCLADSQNNCNDTGRTLVRYVNTVCAQDASAAADLQQEIDEYIQASQNSGTDPGLPSLDPNNPGNGVPEPDYDPADRP
ncbi:hypothetical protein [Stackebrandtia soli]|uniref:hypothetical protein n=1 Tax=Stackebrandtia soli TaxID=1892856 RepID=UPI0039ED5D5C